MKSWGARSAAVGILFAVLFFLLSCGLLFSFLYVALGHSPGNQQRRGKVRELLCRLYGAQEVSFESSHGVHLAGLLMRAKQPKGTVILCHGYRHSKELMSRYLPLFRDYNTLLFDFRGAGQSGGFFSSVGYYESDDVKAAIAFVRAVLPPNEQRPLILFGVSMGAAAVLKAASEVSVGIDGIILDSSYSSLKNIIHQAAHHFSFIPASLIGCVSSIMEMIIGPILSMEPTRYVTRLAMPALFIHASTDSITNPAHRICLFRLMHQQRRARARLWLTPPAKHAYCYVSYPYEYRKRVEQFLSGI